MHPARRRLAFGTPECPNRILATVATWPERWRDEFEERAAIMQFMQPMTWYSATLFAYVCILECAEAEGVSLPNVESQPVRRLACRL